MHTDELKKLVTGKEVKDIEFIYGISGHCCFVRTIVFTDGTKLSFSVVPESDFYGNVINEKAPWVWDGLRVFGELK